MQKNDSTLNSNSSAEIMAYFNRTEELSAFIQFSLSEGNNRSMAVHLLSRRKQCCMCLGPTSGPPFLFTDSSSFRKVKAESFFLVFFFLCKNCKNVVWHSLLALLYHHLLFVRGKKMLKSLRIWFQLMTGDLKWRKGIIIYVPPAKHGNMRSYLTSNCRKPNLLRMCLAFDTLHF